MLLAPSRGRPVMSDAEKQLRANVLDALDRLYDRTCSVADLVALLFATSIALSGTAIAPLLDSTRVRLERLVHSGASHEALYNAGLEATDELRRELAKRGA